jgi:putative tryptophan/tyrosine transport system substrate-binding protein
MTDRRTFIGAAAACFAAQPLALAAQPARVPRVGILNNGFASSVSPQFSAFRDGMRSLGWIEGERVVFESRWAEGRPERIPALIDELVRAKVDVIVVSGPGAINAAKRATTRIPVVFLLLVDPVSMGFVQSLARPGGNLTGVSSQFEELITKQLQLLKEAVPGLSRVAMLRHAEGAQAILQSALDAARRLGLEARPLTVTGVGDLESAFKQARGERVGAVQVLPSPYLGAQRAALIDVAARYRLPAIYELRFYALDGGLMSYGPNIDRMWVRAASYVDRILKGAKPGDLAIEQAERFDLVINLKTAAALGIIIPPSLLQRADEVIQ